MAYGFVFPGQGSQYVGMAHLARSFSSARRVFDEVNEALQQDLLTLIEEGSEEDLALTANAQPALMAVSLSVAKVLEEELGESLSQRGAYFAGHSLGEYTALVVLGSLGLAEGARLLRARGQAMQAAVPLNVGSMAAILGLDLAEVEDLTKVAAGGEVCEIANDNSPGQVVISGHRGAVERAVSLAKERGARKGIVLNVSAPFHCSLMTPAAQTMQELLEVTPLSPPPKPIVQNVTALPTKDTEDLREGLVRQTCSRVRWRESVMAMLASGVDTFYEVGAGKVLCGLIKRAERRAKAHPVGKEEELRSLLSSRLSP